VSPDQRSLFEPTSVEAYYDAKDSGKIGVMQRKVLSAIRLCDPTKGITGRELDDSLAASGNAAASYHKRVSELERKGLITVLRVRPCSRSGKMAKAYIAVPKK
jgi:hypothetical protein